MSSNTTTMTTTTATSTSIESGSIRVSESVSNDMARDEPESTKTKTTHRILLMPSPGVKPKIWTYSDEQKEKIEEVGDVCTNFHFFHFAIRGVSCDSLWEVLIITVCQDDHVVGE